MERKLDALRQHGIQHVLLNGPSGSLEHLRRFAHDIMPGMTASPVRSAVA